MTTRYAYTVPEYIRDLDDPAANLAHFLLQNTDSIWGVFDGHIRAADQRRLFGRFLGKGRVTINGARETVAHRYKTCFGYDTETNHFLDWRQL